MYAESPDNTGTISTQSENANEMCNQKWQPNQRKNSGNNHLEHSAQTKRLCNSSSS